jgi:hypothetical protein
LIVPFTIRPLPPGIRMTVVLVASAMLIAAVIISHRGAILLPTTSDGELPEPHPSKEG